MATITGAMTTTNVLSDQLAIDLGDRISLLEPSAQPLAVFTRKANKKRTVATKFSWLEDQSKPRFDTQNGGATNVATTVAVTNGAYFQQWDQVLNTRTGEQFRVDAVAGNNLTVTRGIGSTGTAMLNGDELYIIGTAQPENDTSKPARSDIPSKVTNNKLNATITVLTDVPPSGALYMVGKSIYASLTGQVVMGGVVTTSTAGGEAEMPD